MAPRPLSLGACPDEWSPPSALSGRPAATPPRPGGGSGVLGRPMGRADSVQLGVAPLRLLPRAGPRLLTSQTEELECVLPRSLLSPLGRGSPSGSCRGKLGPPPPGVGPHLLLINCGGLLPRLVTGPGSWDWSFRDLLWLRISYCLSVARPTGCPLEARRGGGGKKEEGPERLKLRWEGLQRGRRGSEQPHFPYIPRPP